MTFGYVLTGPVWSRRTKAWCFGRINLKSLASANSARKKRLALVRCVIYVEVDLITGSTILLYPSVYVQAKAKSEMYSIVGMHHTDGEPGLPCPKLT